MVTRRLMPVPLSRVRLFCGFWGPWLEAVRSQTLPHIYQALRDTGRLDAWKLDWREGQPSRPHVFWDSDVAKWMEAAAYSLVCHPDPALEAQLEAIIDLMERAQAKDGYLNSYFLTVEPGGRWANERDQHELYCAGHLMEAAVAHYEATGRRRFLDILCRYADHIAAVFGPGEGQKRGYPGHQEIELALVRLWRATGERRYLALAQFFVDERGRQPHFFDVEATARGEDPAGYRSRFFGNFHFASYRYFQAHQPVREQSEAVGHAVRAMYLYSGMADLAMETGDQSLLDACERLWQSVDRRMYVTGGVGAVGRIEGFSTDYDLPNETAFAETCAAIGLALWAHRMQQAEPDGRYADTFERVLYNGILSGLALDGRRFFYRNPLAFYAEDEQTIPEDRAGQRQPWFGCACCPPNIARFLAGLGQFVYSCSQDEIYVHLYAQSQADLRVAGQAVELRLETDYPWEGEVTIRMAMAAPTRFTLALRAPAWCRGIVTRVGGEVAAAKREAGYLKIARVWKPGETVTLEMEMPIEKVGADPRVRADCGRVALQRGPVIYCLEEADNGPSLEAIRLPAEAALRAEREPQMLGGAAVVRGEGCRLAANPPPGEGLYRPGHGQSESPFPIAAVPYALRANREAGEMIVWVRT
jgi:uncharacterized protein